MPELELSHSFSSSCGHLAHGSIGTGPDVVLVHGTPTSSYIWTSVADRLKDRYHLHNLDLPGYGRSEMFEGQEVRLRSFARVLAELSQKNFDRPPVLVGHDFGAAAVLGAHLAEGAAASAICICDGVVLSPWGTPFSRHVQSHKDAFSNVPEYVHAAVLRAHLDTAVSRILSSQEMDALIDPWLGAQGQAAYYRQVGQCDYEYTETLEKKYGAIDIPLHVIWGNRIDGSISPKDAGLPT